MGTLRPILLVMVLALAGCNSMGMGGGKPVLAAANNPLPATQAPPQNEFFALLNGEAGEAAFAAQNQALQAPSGGIAVPWQGGGTSGTVTPGPIHVVNDRACRDVVLVTEREMERLRGRSTLCLTREGDWEPLGTL